MMVKEGHSSPWWERTRRALGHLEVWDTSLPFLGFPKWPFTDQLKTGE